MIYPQPNLVGMSADDEAMLREHHATDGGYERCIICRLLATIDDLRRAEAIGDYGLIAEAITTEWSNGNVDDEAYDRLIERIAAIRVSR